MADKLPKKQPKKARGGTRERGPKGGTQPKRNPRKCGKVPKRTRDNHKKNDPKWDRGPAKRRTSRGGKAKGRGDGRRKAKKGTAQSRNQPTKSHKNHTRDQREAKEPGGNAKNLKRPRGSRTGGT